MRPTQSALVVTVPEVESAVAPWRRELDRAAGWGVPAHVTVLFPFLAPAELDDAVAALRSAILRVPAFDVTFARTAWFGEDVVYLAPEPDTGFRELTAAVMAAFPGLLPYGGDFGTDPVPHLTLGHLGGVPRLQSAERAVTPALPLNARVDAVSLLWGSPAPGAWSERDRFLLG